jgi:hypothetical protein
VQAFLVYTFKIDNGMKLLLFILISFVALTAIISGLLIISKPDGSIINIPISLLQNTPFKNFLVPGIILTAVVGGINLVAVVYNIKRHAARYNWAMAGGITITGWIIVQMVLIGTFNWLQFIYLGTGVLTILVAYQLKGKFTAMKKLIKRVMKVPAVMILVWAALTVGSGSTKASQKAFERLLVGQGSGIIASRLPWLLKPNDELRMKENNVMVAPDVAQQWAGELANKLY